MSYADLRIVAIALILAVTYGTFLYLNANAQTTSITNPGLTNTTDYNTPNSGSFWSDLTTITTMQASNPEIFFINTMLYGIIGFLLVFIFLRFLRGTG